MVDSILVPLQVLANQVAPQAERQAAALHTSQATSMPSPNQLIDIIPPVAPQMSWSFIADLLIVIAILCLLWLLARHFLRALRPIRILFRVSALCKQQCAGKGGSPKETERLLWALMSELYSWQDWLKHHFAAEPGFAAYQTEQVQFAELFQKWQVSAYDMPTAETHVSREKCCQNLIALQRALRAQFWRLERARIKLQWVSFKQSATRILGRALWKR